MLAESQNSLRTRTVHSEVLWALNPTNNISEAIRRYGVSDNTTALIVVRIGTCNMDIQKPMETAVAGTLRPMTSLGALTDWASIKKVGTVFFCLLVDNLLTDE